MPTVWPETTSNVPVSLVALLGRLVCRSCLGRSLIGYWKRLGLLGVVPDVSIVAGEEELDVEPVVLGVVALAPTEGAVKVMAIVLADIAPAST